MSNEIQTDWLLATLEDAYASLGKAVDELSRHPEEAEEIMAGTLCEAYAKLNYAVNTARCGAAGLEEMADDELVRYPSELPFLGPDESADNAKDSPDTLQ